VHALHQKVRQIPPTFYIINAKNFKIAS